MSDKMKPGRPKGAKTKPRDVVTATPTRCKVCGSTERGPITQTKRTPHSGWTPGGEPYTEIVRRWTSCATCGQVRIDRSYEYQPDTGVLATAEN